MPFSLKQIKENNMNVKLTPEGGIAVQYINACAGPSVKGTCVTIKDSAPWSVTEVPIQVPNCIGIVYEDNIAVGDRVWVVISGIAPVLFWTPTIAGQLARTGLTVDVGEVAGKAIAENIPTSPFGVDKHFCEIGHVIETNTAPGLANVNLHFN